MTTVRDTKYSYLTVTSAVRAPAPSGKSCHCADRQAARVRSLDTGGRLLPPRISQAWGPWGRPRTHHPRPQQDGGNGAARRSQGAFGPFRSGCIATEEGIFDLADARGSGCGMGKLSCGELSHARWPFSSPKDGFTGAGRPVGYPSRNGCSQFPGTTAKTSMSCWVSLVMTISPVALHSAEGKCDPVASFFCLWYYG